MYKDGIEGIGIEKILSADEEVTFIKALSVRKDLLLLGLLQLDCCIRVSEAITLKIEDFDFDNKTINVSRLKKRRFVKSTIPYSPRVQQALAKYWKDVEDKNLDSFMFATKYKKSSKRGHVSRQHIHRKFRQLGDANPHKLRHTGISNMVQNGTPLNVVKTIAGHSSIATTSLYIWADSNSMRQAVNNRAPKLSWYERAKAQLFKEKPIYMQPMKIGNTANYIGREIEVARLNKLVKNKQNCVVLGKSGIGKSRLLNEIEGDNVLRIDDMKGIITTLTGMLAHIIKQKPDEMALLKLDGNKMTTLSQKNLIETMEKLTIKNEFTIVIDDISSLTEVTCNVLKRLANHFHIVAACREMLIKFGALLTGFIKIQLKELTREESLILIRNCSASFRKKIDDPTMFEGHIWNKSNGNPQKIIKLCEIFSIEARITTKELSDVDLLGKERTKSLMPFLLILLMLAAIKKYTGREYSEVDKIGYAAIAATVMFIAIAIRFSRRSFSTNKI
jgi:integrase/recombinase XerD